MRSVYVHRQIEKALIRAARQFPAVAVTGPRQSGKSTLLRHLFRKTHRYLTFDDPMFREEARTDPRLFLERFGPRVVIDEIQYVPEILSHIKIAIDAQRQKRGRFLLTGSQQFPLIKNLGDSLAGRIALLELLPFSAAEKKDAGFVHACLWGSYPELAIRKNVDRNAWYGAYLSTYLERDVRGLYDIGNLRDFQRFIQMLASRTSQILNLSQLAADLGISVNTAKKWLSVLEASRTVYLLSPYFENFGKRVVRSPKVYFLDCGLVCYLTGVRNREHLLKGPMAGALFETFCVQETVKSFLNRGMRPDIYYLRTHNDLEIDLIIRSGAALYPIEIKLTKTPRFSMTSPIQRYKALFPKLDIREGRLVCLTDESFPLGRGIVAQSLGDYFSWLWAG